MCNAWTKSKTINLKNSTSTESFASQTTPECVRNMLQIATKNFLLNFWKQIYHESICAFRKLNIFKFYSNEVKEYTKFISNQWRCWSHELQLSPYQKQLSLTTERERNKAWNQQLEGNVLTRFQW
jgi:hypothetical protein